MILTVNTKICKRTHLSRKMIQATDGKDGKANQYEKK